MATDSKLQKHLHGNTPSPQKAVSRSGFLLCLLMTAVFLCVLLHCFTPCPFWRKKKKHKEEIEKTTTFYLLIRWSHQLSIEMRLSPLRQIEWPKKEHGGSKSKRSLIWSCEWQYWFAFSFLTGKDGDSESEVMATITVTTGCFSCFCGPLSSLCSMSLSICFCLQCDTFTAVKL